MTKTRRAKIDELTPDARNANEGTERGLQMLDDSLRQYGAGRSILVDKHGRVIAGNKTVERAADVGLDDVIIVETDGKQLVAVQRTDLDLDDEAARKLAYFDNRVGELDLSWNAEAILADIAGGLDLSDIFDNKALSDIGVDLKLQPPDDPGAQMNKADELQKKWGVQAGDLWLIGDDHRLICGDCTDRAVVERLMGGKKAELGFTSPPYLDFRDYGGNDVSLGALLAFIPLMVKSCNYSVVNLGLKFIDGMVVQYWNNYIDGFEECGQMLLAWNVWNKVSGSSIANATNMFYIIHEWIFVFGNSRKRLNRTVPNDLDGYATRFGDGFLNGLNNKPVRQKSGETKVTTSAAYTHHQLESVINQHPEKGAIRKSHPATFPVELPENYIDAMTNVGEAVFDPFAGSGTTGIAAHRLGRKARLIEIHPPYCAVILERFADIGVDAARAE